MDEYTVHPTNSMNSRTRRLTAPGIDLSFDQTAHSIQKNRKSDGGKPSDFQLICLPKEGGRKKEEGRRKGKKEVENKVSVI